MQTATVASAAYSIVQPIQMAWRVARPFGEFSAPTAALPACSNWRDSETGLAFAPIPFDVNVALVPAALRAIEVGWGAVPVQQMAPVSPPCTDNSRYVSHLPSMPPLPCQNMQQLSEAGILDPRMQSEAAELAAAWERDAAPFFEITIPAAQASSPVCYKAMVCRCVPGL